MLRKLLALSAVVLSLLGCSGVSEGEKVTYTRLSEIPADKIEALSKKSYFFGHQSVGRNILDGLRLLMAEYPAIKLNVVEGVDAAQVQPGVFLHANLGQNRYPATKMEAFTQALDGGLGGKVDAAFLKFCYVDLNREGDPAALFADYKASVEALKKKYPNTTFVHFTMPIKTVPTGIKVSIKNLIGREVPEQVDNVKRGAFNDMLRAEYLGKEPVFDIARLESIAASTGTRTTFKYNGVEVEAMAPENTDDGGHLTDAGKRWIAEQLVVFLVNLG